MNEEFMFDADFNNFYEDFVGKNRKNKKADTETKPTSSSTQTAPIPLDWSKGMVVGASSPAKEPVKEPEKKKGGLFSGLGSFLKSETGQSVLGGISRGIENRQGLGGSGGSGGGGGFEDAPNQGQGLSTGAMIGIAVGGLAVVGLAIYLVTKK